MAADSAAEEHPVIMNLPPWLQPAVEIYDEERVVPVVDVYIEETVYSPSNDHTERWWLERGDDPSTAPRLVTPPLERMLGRTDRPPAETGSNDGWPYGESAATDYELWERCSGLRGSAVPSSKESVDAALSVAEICPSTEPDADAWPDFRRWETVPLTFVGERGWWVDKCRRKFSSVPPEQPNDLVL